MQRYERARTTVGRRGCGKAWTGIGGLDLVWRLRTGVGMGPGSGWIRGCLQIPLVGPSPDLSISKLREDPRFDERASSHHHRVRPGRLQACTATGRSRTLSKLIAVATAVTAGGG